MQLRDYQLNLLDDVAEAREAGAKAVLAVMPTGSGKTVTFAKYAGEQHLPGCAIVHRVELVAQISMTFGRWGIRHRLIAPEPTVRAIRSEHFREFGRTFDNPHAPTSVASVDTLLSRVDIFREYISQCGWYIIDEAAHVLRENKWGAAAQLFNPAAFGIGFTATPKRADGKGLGKSSDGIFDAMVQGPTTAELIALGHLSRYKIIAKPSDMKVDDLIATASGDYSHQKLRTRSHESHIVGDVVKEYLQHAPGKQGICFTVDVQDAEHLAQRFNEAGVPAAAVSAQTPEGERQDAVRRFRAGELRQLTNCDLFGEGFDVPGVECVSLARPTMSLALHLQQVGRALRPLPGKSHAIILDHVGNWQRHGLPDSPRVWSLDVPKRKSRGLELEGGLQCTTCLECFLVFQRKLLPKCPHCGAVREPGERSKPENVDGDLIEIDPDVLAQMREAIQLESPDDIRRRVSRAAGRIAGRGAYNKQKERIEAQAALQDAIAIWAGVRKDAGQEDSASYREFFLTFGVDVLTAQALPRAEMDALRERINAHG